MFRDILRIFVPAFLLFFGVGAVAGWEERKDTAFEWVYKKLDVIEKNDKYFLVLDCRGFVFDIDTDKSRIKGGIVQSAAFHKTALGARSEHHMKIFGLVSSFFGGAYTHRDFRRWLASSQKARSFWSWKQLQKTLLGILGTISGYWAGNWVASHYDTTCKSDIVAELLRDPATLRAFELTYLTISIKELETTEDAIIWGTELVNKTPWEADPVYSCPTTLRPSIDAFYRSFRQTDINPESEHYQKVDMIKKAHNRAKNTKAYKWLIDKRKYKFSPSRADKEYPNLDKTVGYSDELWNENCQKLNAVISEDTG